MTDFKTILLSAEPMSYWGNREIKNVRLVEGVRSIGECAFGFSSLQEIELPSSVKAIGSCAFAGLLGLKSITIPEGTTMLGSMVFAGCTALEKVVLPSTLMETGSQIFYECANLKRIEVPGSVFKKFQYSDWVREHDNIIIIIVDKAHNPAVVEPHQNEMNKRSEQLLAAETVKSISAQNEEEDSEPLETVLGQQSTDQAITIGNPLSEHATHEPETSIESMDSTVADLRESIGEAIEETDEIASQPDEISGNSMTSQTEDLDNDALESPVPRLNSFLAWQQEKAERKASQPDPGLSTLQTETVVENEKGSDESNTSNPISQERLTDDLPVETLGLSKRAFNGLKRNKIHTINQLCGCSIDDLMKMPLIGKTSVQEILERLNSFFVERVSSDTSVMDEGVESQPVREPSMTIRTSDGSILAIEDLSLDQIGLSARAYNGLQRGGISSVAEMLNCSESDLLAIKNLGKNSVREILKKSDDLREKALALKKRTALEKLPDGIQQALKDYHSTVHGAFASQLDEVICDTIANNVSMTQESIIAAVSENERAISIGREILFNMVSRNGFFGLEQSAVEQCLPTFLGDSYVSACIAASKSDDRVVWNYGRIIPTFRSANDLIYEYADVRIKNIINGRKHGKSLAEIAEELNVTRERVRQIEAKFWRQIKANREVFAEDKYLPLYEKYDFDGKTFRAIFGETQETWYIINNRGERGRNIGDRAQLLDLESAMYDESLLPELREAIIQFYKSIEDASYVQIGSDRIPARREDFENYVLEHYCQDEMSVDDFFDLYNSILEGAGCEREDLFANESVRRTRENRLSDFRNVLWAFKRRLRYYDADRYDLNSLFRRLKLDRFWNIEISTRKLMLENPGLMVEYDIRNEYELHNLMKKHGADEVCGDLVFGKMPMLQFGNVDRSKFITDMLFSMAPISKEDFFAAVSEATGIQPELIWTKPEFVSALDVYLHDGMLTINSDPMPDDEMDALLNSLTEECYTIDEVRRQYTKVTGNRNTDLVSPYNLKRMGFKVFSGYVLRSAASATAFFEGMLTGSEIVDYSEYAKRFAYVTEWSVALNKLKDEFRIIEFAPQQVIRMDRLNKFGVDRTSLMAFCDAVYDYTDPGEYFTIQSIRKDGFESSLFNLGFEDWFYSSILREDNRFGFRRMGEGKPIIVFCRDVPKVTRRSFITYILDGESEDIDELFADIENTYGVIFDKYDIGQIIGGSNLYYDSTMGKIYSDKEQYYEEV